MATSKKTTRKRKNATELIVAKLVAMPHGELARLPAALVKKDAEVAAFLLQQLAAALPSPTVAGTGANPDDSSPID